MSSTPPSSSSRSVQGTSLTLLSGLRARDPAAWERLVRLYGPSVRAWCRRAGLDDSRAADVFQEVFQSIDLHFARFRPARGAGSFRGWLRVIARNKIRDVFRADQRQPQAAGGTDAWQRLDALPAPAHDSADGDAGGDADVLDVSVLWRALEPIRTHFEDQTWRAFWMTAVEGRSTHDVAADLGTSAGAVRVAKCRVLQRLREELAEFGTVRARPCSESLQPPLGPAGG